MVNEKNLWMYTRDDEEELIHKRGKFKIATLVFGVKKKIVTINIFYVFSAV